MSIRQPGNPSERGYSLAEMLTVVAIIGVLSLFIVPNFMSMYRANKLKTSMRQFTNDLRAARQQAVTRSGLVRIAFTDKGRIYYIFQSTDQGASWQPLGTNPKYIDETVTFVNSSGGTAFTDPIDEGALGDLPDIIFQSNGGARVTSGTGIVALQSQFTDISRPSYSVAVRNTGVVTVQ